MADQSQLYDALESRAEAIWGKNNRTIQYAYDDNGSLIEKKTIVTPVDEADPEVMVELVTYEYNLQNRLKQVMTTPYSAGQPLTSVGVSYEYNESGIRTACITDGVRVDYLIDPANPTGYAQVLEEWQAGQTEPAVSYLIGDDVIAQTSGGQTRVMLYDGHGSVRQHTTLAGNLVSYSHDPDGDGPASSIAYNSFDYDGYGVSLNPLQGSSLGYTGEQYDSALGQYCLRARYYDPANGRFNRMDPYTGNMTDPQSLHKYLYCHGNPVNCIDPSGKIGLLMGAFIAVLIVSLVMHVIVPIVRAIHRRIVTAPAARLLAEVRRAMESSGWYNVGPDVGPDNALAHATANIIAVGSDLFDNPGDALRAFQLREQGNGLNARMDRANNQAGNSLAAQYQKQNPRNSLIFYLKRLQLTWIENDQLVRGTYPEPDKINQLSPLLEQYWGHN